MNRETILVIKFYVFLIILLIGLAVEIFLFIDAIRTLAQLLA